MLARIAYFSRSLIGGWSPDLLDIARVALARNASLDVTGALYFDRLRFFQMLEGERATLDALMLGIAADPRHLDLQVLIEGPIRVRRFGRWHMRFIDGDAHDRLASAVPEPASPGDASRLADRAERFVEALAAH
ncbi:MAG: BLUF domain-containing protein [Paracoccaceae bacterium]